MEYKYLEISSIGGLNDSFCLSILPNELKSRNNLIEKVSICNIASEIDSFVKSRLPKNESITYHIYEGNLNLFLLALELADKDPNSKIIFNFHWFQDEKTLIRDLFENSQYSIELIQYYIDNERLFLSCESKVNSQTLQRIVKRPTPKYPTFSVYSSTYKKVMKDLIIVIPSSQSEIDFLHKSLKRIITVLSGYKIICLGHWEKSNSKFNYSHLSDLGLDLRLGYIPAEEYVALLNQSEIMILPYQTFKWYKSGSSGRLEDALAHKSFVIVPQDTSLYRDNRKLPFTIGYWRCSTLSLISSIFYILIFKKHVVKFLANYNFDSSVSKLLLYVSKIHN